MTTPSAPAGRGRLPFLNGIRVLEIGDGVAGAATSSLLQDLGADVTTVTDRTSPHRRFRPSGVGPAADASLLSIVLDDGKHLVPVPRRLDELARLIADGAGNSPLTW